MPVFFEFLDDRYWVGPARTVALGPAGIVREHLDEDQLLQAFGGYVLYVDEPSAQLFLGVLDRKRAERFYQVLRAKGVEIDVVAERPAKLRLHARRA